MVAPVLATKEGLKILLTGGVAGGLAGVFLGPVAWGAIVIWSTAKLSLMQYKMIKDEEREEEEWAREEERIIQEEEAEEAAYQAQIEASQPRKPEPRPTGKIKMIRVEMKSRL